MAKPPKYTNKDLQRLAIAGYNMGPSALTKILKEHKTLSYDKIKKYLPKETQDLVAFAETNRPDEGGVEMYGPFVHEAFDLSNQGVIDMNNLDLPMLSAHIYRESYSPKTQTKYDLNAYNPSGAKGLGQFTPITIEEFKRLGWLKEGEDPYSADKAPELILRYQDHMAKNFSDLAKSFKLGGPIPKAQVGLNNNWIGGINQFLTQMSIPQPPVLSSDGPGMDYTQFPITEPGMHKRPKLPPLQPLSLPTIGPITTSLQTLTQPISSTLSSGFQKTSSDENDKYFDGEPPDEESPNIWDKVKDAGRQVGSTVGNILPMVGGMAMNFGALALAQNQKRELSQQSMFGEMARYMKNATVPINKGMNASMLPMAKFGGSIPTSNLGQWKYPGQTVKVPSNNITMQGISHPNLGIGDNGMVQMMFPGMNYKFPGAKSVIEIPMLQYGGVGVKKYQEGELVSPPEYGPKDKEQLQNYFSNQLLPHFESQYGPVQGVDKAMTWMQSNHPDAYNAFVTPKSIDSPTDNIPPDPFFIGNAYLGELSNIFTGRNNGFDPLRPLTGNTQLTLSQSLGVENPIGAFVLDMIEPGGVLGTGSLMRKMMSKTAGSKLSNALNKTNDVVKPISSFADDVGKQASKQWQLKELPGLHLKSTMEGQAISKIIEPKTGLINVEQALGIIGKESGGADKVKLIKEALGDNIPKKMDYNEFRKVVQDQLIPLERQFSEQASNYGIGKLGYPSPKRSSFESAIKHANIEKNKQLQIIKEYEGYLKKPSKYKKAFPYESNLNKTNDELIPHIKSALDDYKQRLAASELQISKNLEDMKQLPLENQTLILGNKSKFGKGSSAHGNPDETLGHIHFLRDAETPDVLTVTQIQSDAFQGTHRIMPDKSNLKEAAEALGPNPIQKQLLDKNHQERYLQELVDYAGKRGDVNKIRVPTSETAAKVQGYSKLEPEVDPERIAKLKRQIEQGKKKALEASPEDKIKWERGVKSLELELQGGYEFRAQTILKKYSEQPKTIKKLFGIEPKIVTDSKGNTWYEFDIPKKFKEGKGEIKAFTTVGAIGTGAASYLQSQQQNNKYQKGGIIDPSLASLSQILTLRNQNLPWVNRALSGNTQAIYNNAGQAQTHLMGYDGPDRNGKNWYDDSHGNTIRVKNDKIKTNEKVKLEDLEYLNPSTNQFEPLLSKTDKKYQSGGYVFEPPKQFQQDNTRVNKVLPNIHGLPTDLVPVGRGYYSPSQNNEEVMRRGSGLLMNPDGSPGQMIMASGQINPVDDPFTMMLVDGSAGLVSKVTAKALSSGAKKLGNSVVGHVIKSGGLKSPANLINSVQSLPEKYTSYRHLFNQFLVPGENSTRLYRKTHPVRGDSPSFSWVFGDNKNLKNMQIVNDLDNAILGSGPGNIFQQNSLSYDSYRFMLKAPVAISAYRNRLNPETIRRMKEYFIPLQTGRYYPMNGLGNLKGISTSQEIMDKLHTAEKSFSKQVPFNVLPSKIESLPSGSKRILLPEISYINAGKDLTWSKFFKVLVQRHTGNVNRFAPRTFGQEVRDAMMNKTTPYGMTDRALPNQHRIRMDRELEETIRNFFGGPNH